MVVVVTDAIFETSGRSSRLNATDQTLGHQQGQRVVHGLKGNGANLGADDVGYGIGRDVRLPRHRAEDGESLRGDLNATLTKKIGRLGSHDQQGRSGFGLTPNFG